MKHLTTHDHADHLEHSAAKAHGPDDAAPHRHGAGTDPGHDGHGAHGHGDHVGMFRRRFWWSLLLTVPVVLTSHMVMDWFGYTLDFPGIEWVGPILGTVIYAWAGWPFLAGGWQELRDRRPGMMLLITMAITVAYAASLATSLDWFDLEFWWELAALVTIMLLGHWQEMKALGQASSALDALAALLPDTADHVMADGTIHDDAGRRPARRRRRARAVRIPGAGRWRDRRRRGRTRRVDGDRRVPADRQDRRGFRRRRDGLDRLGDPGPSRQGRRRHRAGRHPTARRRGAGVEEPGPGAGRPLRRAAVLRRRRCGCRHVHRLVAARQPGRCRGADRDGAGDRLPPRTRARDPAGRLAVERDRCRATASWSRTGWRSSGCATSTPCCSTRPGR